MDKVILAGILFVIILFLCFMAFAGGLYLGLKYKERPPKAELTEEQKKAIEKMQREEKNFWEYSG